MNPAVPGDAPEPRPVSGLARPARVLVTGATGGIGRALVRRLLADPLVATVVATARGVDNDAALAGFSARHGDRLWIQATDITDPDQLAALATRIGTRLGALDLVVNAAGLLHGPGLAPEKSVTQVRREALERVFAVNAFAPILLAQALLPLLRTGPAVFASLSARVGSIGDNRLGGWYAYRAAKAAQNQLVRTFAIELARVNPAATCLLLHPGTVDTPLSAPFQARVPADRLFTSDQAAAQLLRVIGQAGPADSGRFLAWDGSDIPF